MACCFIWCYQQSNVSQATCLSFTKQHPGTSRPRHHPAATAGDTGLHRSWPVAAKQSRSEPCLLPDVQHWVGYISKWRRRAEAVPRWSVGWSAVHCHWLGCQPVETVTEGVRACVRACIGTTYIMSTVVVNSTFKKYWQYQYQYFFGIVEAIPILGLEETTADHIDNVHHAAIIANSHKKLCELCNSVSWKYWLLVLVEMSYQYS